MPTKHDWLIPIQENVKWVSFNTIYSKIGIFMESIFHLWFG